MLALGVLMKKEVAWGRATIAHLTLKKKSNDSSSLLPSPTHNLRNFEFDEALSASPLHYFENARTLIFLPPPTHTHAVTR